MKWDELSREPCSVARSVAVIGDRWTLLILRDCFLGVRRFEAFQERLGISRTIIADRLKVLTDEGVLAKVAYQDRPVRHEYRLTDKGLDFYPLLLSLKAWGEKWGGFAPKARPALSIVHRHCGHPAQIRLTCPSCDGPFGPKDVNVTLGSAFEAERQARRARA